MMLSFKEVAQYLANFSPETLSLVSRKITEAKAMAADGLTFEEVSTFLHGAIDDVMHSLANLDVAGKLKREVVLVMVTRLLEVLPTLPLPAWMGFLPAFLAQPVVRQFVMWFAGGVIESLYKRYINPLKFRLVPPPAA
jgi:hypothetical protein